MTKVTENDIELYAIEELENLGYTYIYGTKALVTIDLYNVKLILDYHLLFFLVLSIERSRFLVIIIVGKVLII
jgi:hypothetical protein